MAFTHLAVLVLFQVTVYPAIKGDPAIAHSKPMLDTNKRRNIVDEAFVEQKDVLLDMLETKLKQIKEKKKKKSEHSDNNGDGVKCEQLPKNVDVNLKTNGIVAVGEADILLKFGLSGKGSLNLDALGISNVGKAHLDLEFGGDGNSLNIPGLNNLLTGSLNPCKTSKNSEGEIKKRKLTNMNLNDAFDLRRSPFTIDLRNETLSNNSTEGPNSASKLTDSTDIKNVTIYPDNSPAITSSVIVANFTTEAVQSTKIGGSTPNP